MTKQWQQLIPTLGPTLLVENSGGRIKSTLRNVPSIYCVAATEMQMQEALSSDMKFDTIMLDYNLTRIWRLGGRQNSLRAIKSYQGVLDIKRVVIISWNPFGAERLRKYITSKYDVEVVKLRHWRVV